MLQRILPFAMLMFFSLQSQATLFKFEDNAANNGGISDRLDSISSTFNSVTNQFTWETTFNADPTDVDGFWLVVNNGPNPKSSNVNELAIMYGDLNSNKLTTYVYNGANNSNSYLNPAIFLQSDALTSNSNSFSLDINATAINNWAGGGVDYTGISFDDNIGIWFHISTGSNFNYGVGDVLNAYSYSSQGWYDRANLTTTRVPEPATLALMGFGLIGLVANRRRKKI